MDMRRVLKTPWSPDTDIWIPKATKDEKMDVKMKKLIPNLFVNKYMDRTAEFEDKRQLLLRILCSISR